ncbi:ABC transporter permease [Alloacidobacterium sp.]|uniref:ABC transporter permease n=1 Tax=Alloacidobacterium sp. TaxID=2951999 RepID=UPI002D241131|nr:ABC transporter permease [Alloacidobacterium sp.]HYK36452.1 ABC transporter permease [Alloacidobacterium sp.]
MPDWSKEVRAAIAGLSLEPTREEDVVEELGQHLRDRYEEMLTRGVDADQAYQTLHSELEDGRLLKGLASTIARAHEPLAAGSSGSARFFGGLGRDVHYAMRQLWNSPGFAVVAILSLALGVGANTAIFQLLDAVRLRLLPVKHPEQLVSVRITHDPNGMTGSFVTNHSDLTFGIWNLLRAQQQGFSDIAVWSPQGHNLSQGGEARNASTLMVSGNFFPMLGVQPVIGRLLSPADDYRGCGTQGAVLSYSFWQKEYGGRDTALGAKIMLDRQPFQIIGVTPPSFHGVDVGRNFDVAIAICSEPAFSGKNSWTDDPMTWWLAAIGRLKPGWTLERANAQLATISPGIFAATLPPKYDDITKKDYLRFQLEAQCADKGVSNLRDGNDPFNILLGLSGLVLLLACANLANLLLARASARQREMALRLTLGASRMHLMRQVLAESVLLAVFGTAAGVCLAQFLSRAVILLFSSSQDSIFLDIPLDWRVLGFAAGLAVLTCILFGLTPALQASHTDPGSAMKASGRGVTSGRNHFALRRILVVSQVALSLVLLVGALLFARSFRNLMTVNVGFEQDHLLVASFDFSPMHILLERRAAFKRELNERLHAIPGVESAAGVFIVPISHSGWDNNVDVPGGPQRKDTFFNSVSQGYFQTMRVPTLAGRDFNDSDTPTSPRVAIVNETFAKQFFGGANPVGKVIYDSGQPDQTYQIVGLVKDMKYRQLREDFPPIIFVATSQEKEPGEGQTFVIRSNEATESLVAEVKRVAQEMNPAMVLNFSTFKTQVRDDLVGERVMATLTGFFGVLAIVLAMIGIYGVISYMVIRRRNEIGVRMALGAARAKILLMVLRESLILLAIGAAIGTGLALAAGIAAASMLYGLKPHDPLTLCASLVSLAVIVIVASFIPARKAASVDPMVVLHEE